MCAQMKTRGSCYSRTDLPIARKRMPLAQLASFVCAMEITLRERHTSAHDNVLREKSQRNSRHLDFALPPQGWGSDFTNDKSGVLRFPGWLLRGGRGCVNAPAARHRLHLAQPCPADAKGRKLVLKPPCELVLRIPNRQGQPNHSIDLLALATKVGFGSPHPPHHHRPSPAA